MPPELEPTGTGVEEKQGTAPPTEGVPAPSPTAEPEGATAERQPVDLDTLPEFQRYKSEEQKRVAAQQRQYQAMQRDLATKQQQLYEIQQRADQAQLEAKLRDLDPEEAKVVRAEHEVERARQEAAYYQQIAYQQQARLVEQENLKGWARHYNQQYGIPLNEMNISYGWKEFLDSVVGRGPRKDTPPPTPQARTPQAPGQVAQHGTARAGPATALGRHQETPMTEKFGKPGSWWLQRTMEAQEEGE